MERTQKYLPASPFPERADFRLRPGTLLGGRYEVQLEIGAPGGDAELYLCTSEDRKYIAKLYRDRLRVDPAALTRRQSARSFFLDKPLEILEYEGCPVELLHYYPNGSMRGQRCDFDELKRWVIPDLNDALRALHEAGEVHRHVCPGNVLQGDDGHTAVLADYGLWPLVGVETLPDAEHAAPETFQGLCGEAADYWALGITLYELYTGRAPFAGMSWTEFERFQKEARIPCPEDMPEELQELIWGLTYPDISGREGEEISDRRWGSDDVKRWINGEPYTVPGLGESRARRRQPFMFMDVPFTDMDALTVALAENWEEGKRQLNRGLLRAYFLDRDPHLAEACRAAEEAGLEGGEDDYAFWRLLYRISPVLHRFYWKGLGFEGLRSLGLELLGRVWAGDETVTNWCEGLLEYNVLTQYLRMTDPDNRALLRTAERVEGYAVEVRSTPEKACCYMAYELSGQRVFRFRGQEYRTVADLGGYMQKLLSESREAFSGLCARLADLDGNLHPQLEAWLVSLGKREELERWRALIEE